MVIHILNEDIICTSDLASFVIPQGTKVVLNGGKYKVDEFDWIENSYAQNAGTIRHETLQAEIRENQVATGLRLKFAYDDSDPCRDIYEAENGVKYCRLKSNRNGTEYAAWYSVTPDFEEPYLPLGTDLIIQILDKQKRVVVCEQNFEEFGIYSAIKQFPFSWEKNQIKQTPDLYNKIYSNRNIRYIIDPEKFHGFVEGIVNENGIVENTGGKTFEEFKKKHKQGQLILLNEKQFAMKLNEFRNSLMEDFEEISEDEFNILYNVLPSYRSNTISGIFFFFQREGFTLGLHTFCFKADEKYYTALRPVTWSKQRLYDDICAFLKKRDKDKQEEKHQPMYQEVPYPNAPSELKALWCPICNTNNPSTRVSLGHIFYSCMACGQKWSNLFVRVSFPEDSRYFEQEDIGYPCFNTGDNGARYVLECEYIRFFKKTPDKGKYFSPVAWPDAQKYMDNPLCEAIIGDEKGLKKFGSSSFWVPVKLLIKKIER